MHPLLLSKHAELVAIEQTNRQTATVWLTSTEAYNCMGSCATEMQVMINVAAQLDSLERNLHSFEANRSVLTTYLPTTPWQAHSAMPLCLG